LVSQVLKHLRSVDVLTRQCKKVADVRGVRVVVKAPADDGHPASVNCMAKHLTGTPAPNG
jgi:acetolactate synthase regulatory subunit